MVDTTMRPSLIVPAGLPINNDDIIVRSTKVGAVWVTDVLTVEDLVGRTTGEASLPSSGTYQLPLLNRISDDYIFPDLTGSLTLTLDANRLVAGRVFRIQLYNATGSPISLTLSGLGTWKTTMPSQIVATNGYLCIEGVCRRGNLAQTFVTHVGA